MLNCKRYHVMMNYKNNPKCAKMCNNNSQNLCYNKNKVSATHSPIAYQFSWISDIIVVQELYALCITNVHRIVTMHPKTMLQIHKTRLLMYYLSYIRKEFIKTKSLKKRNS